MTPNLATIVAAYVAFRMFEIFFLDSRKYASQTGHRVLGALAVLVLLVTGFCWLSIVLAPSTPLSR